MFCTQEPHLYRHLGGPPSPLWLPLGLMGSSGSSWNGGGKPGLGNSFQLTLQAAPRSGELLHLRGAFSKTISSSGFSISSVPGRKTSPPSVACGYFTTLCVLPKSLLIVIHELFLSYSNMINNILYFFFWGGEE
uniref:Uncharacterized protein n=1 Tax=Molossus molossus TaxID=27622 RepID=A0A7J8BMB9_MOLMO|nr:hypothetical protein HJG59_010131 [Molossus molossus]